MQDNERRMQREIEDHERQIEALQRELEQRHGSLSGFDVDVPADGGDETSTTTDA